MTEFYITVEFSGRTWDDIDLLYEHGLDNGLIHGSGNRTFVDLDIEAQTFDEAASIAASRVERAGASVVCVLPGDQVPPHNSEKVIARYQANVQKYVRSVVNGARLFLNRRS